MILWKKKSRKNRRVWRESYLLEVKTPLNRRFSRQAELARRIGVVAGIAAVAGLLAWGGWSLISRHFYYENSDFKIKRITVTTDGVLPVEELTRWSGVPRGQNLASVDVTKVRKVVESVPMVKEAQVSKSFPDALVVRVQERVAVAKLVPNGTTAMYFLDKDGVAFTAVRGSDGKPILPANGSKLPVVTGISADKVTTGQLVRSEGARQAIDLILRCQKMEITGAFELRGVDVGQIGTLKMTMGRGGVVAVESQNLDAQLQRLHVILWRSKNERREVRTADLRQERNAVVTYF